MTGEGCRRRLEKVLVGKGCMQMRVRKNMKRKAGAAVLVLSPFVMFGVFEWITGNLMEIEPVFLMMNLVLFFLLYFVVFAVTNSMRVGFTVLNVVLTVWALAEHFVVEFRGRPIMIWDIMAFGTAMTVADTYQYDITLQIAAAVVVMILWTVLIWLLPVRLPSKKVWMGTAAGALASMALFLTVFFQYGITALGMEINMWYPSWSYAQYGYLLSTLRVMDYLSIDPPEGYSLWTVREMQEEIWDWEEEEDTPLWSTESDVVPENIICIMNESYADLRVVNDFETDLPFMEFYDSLEKNCIKGNLYMPVFGAMTSNSEYEFLTGISIAFTPSGSVPYQIYMRNPSYGLTSILKEQGYRTVAMHPNEKANWNRDEAYRNMLFDEFYGIESFLDSPTIRGYVSDLGNYQKIIQLTEEKEEGQPLFVFDVTMQNHGGYEMDYPSTVHLTDYENMPMTEQYLSLMRESDQALQYLLEYYASVDEPTMIILFGDHQPSVETEFYEALYGCSLDEVEEEDYLRQYITPFFIWTNYDTESMLEENLSAMFLSCAILERANLQATDFVSFLRYLYQQLPVVHILGYYTSDGAWENWDGWEEKEEYPLLHQYDLLRYHYMFERNQIASLFQVSG